MLGLGLPGVVPRSSDSRTEGFAFENATNSSRVSTPAACGDGVLIEQFTITHKHQF